jgi:carbon-nitrogen hydrolase
MSAMKKPGARELFVLLWTFYEPRLLEVEQDFARYAISPLRFQRLSLATDVLVRQLAGLPDPARHPVDFDKAALTLLVTLDAMLSDRAEDTYAQIETPGCDGREHLILRRHLLIADHYHSSLTWAKHQGNSMFAYADRHVVVPVAGPEWRAYRDILVWGGREIREALAAATTGLRIVLAPLSIDIDYPERAKLFEKPPPQYVSLRDPVNANELKAEVLQAIDDAAAARATILMFPELAIPLALDAEIREHLRARRSAFPILTVYGLCHVAAGDGTDLNEAVVVSPRGKELHRHTKLRPFGNAHLAASERLTMGDTITVLGSPIGDLTLLICLDLFHEDIKPRLRQTGASLFLVPSLSPLVDPHRREAQDLVRSQLAATFVCNRPLSPAPATAQNASFAVLPHSGKNVTRHRPRRAKYLEWEL